MTESDRPRILVVTRNLPPLLGGMERLNWHLLEELSHWAEVRAIGPRGAASLAPPGVAVHEAGRRGLPGFLSGAAWRAVVEARAWRPDMVLAGSGLVAPLVRWAARLSGAASMAYVHGLDITVPNALYRRLWLPEIRRLGRVVANSMATAELARHAGVVTQRLGVVHPGVALAPPATDLTEAAHRFRTEHGLGQRPLLLSVGRLTARKGLDAFVRDVLPMVVSARPDAALLIVGDTPADALYGSGATPQAIHDIARAAGVDAQVRLLGRLPEPGLQAAYAASNVHVFPVRAMPGDPEGFGMVAVEAAAYGVPTVAYAVGGVVEAVADGISGTLVVPDDARGFAAAVLETLRAPPAPETVRGHAAHFRWEAFGARLRGEVERCMADRRAAGSTH